MGAYGWRRECWIEGVCYCWLDDFTAAADDDDDNNVDKKIK